MWNAGSANWANALGMNGSLDKFARDRDVVRKGRETAGHGDARRHDYSSVCQASPAMREPEKADRGGW